MDAIVVGAGPNGLSAPGVHGMCGYHAARAALRRRWGIHLPRSPQR